ncbi:LytR C-terminal domain-containing protein [Sphingomonas daechungensis]|uniref:LytR C-terminal domain-containing protein n=1 Tax=Sphingomonas daechungensis TaxID=1176646 RepID=UPI0037831E16
MKRGAKFLVSVTIVTMVGGCGEDGKLSIRSTPTPIAEGKQPVPARIAEARGQFALGNVALALSAYRMAARDDPNSTDALVGMAKCYDQMGRYDLSRRNYEAALALAPGDTQILAALVSSLQLQGRTDEAIAVREEIAARMAASQALDSAEYVAEVEVVPAPVTAPAPAERIVSPNRPAPAADVAVAEVQLPSRTFAEAPVYLAVPAPAPVTLNVAPGQTGRVEMAVVERVATPAPQAAPVIQAASSPQSVSIKLPAARPVQPATVPVAKRAFGAAPVQLADSAAPAQPMRVEVAGDLMTPYLARPFDETPQRLSFAEERGPYLERISMGEIALVTVPKPVWQPTTVALSSRSTTVRFVPLREASANAIPVKVRLLNAARVDRLAARTRMWLNARGWRGLSIGNALATRSRSVILYPADKRVVAQRLSTQFGFPMAPRASGAHIVILLGSDAARRPALRRASA